MSKNKYKNFDYSLNHYSRNWTIELYEFEVKENDIVVYTHNDVLKYITDHYQQYIWIKHDKDIWTDEDIEKNKVYCKENNIQKGQNKKVHYHIVCRFFNPRYRDTIAKELKYDRRFILPVISSFKDALLYITHERYPEKYHYKVEECTGTLILELQKLVQNQILDEDKSNEILMLIMSRDNWTKYKLLKAINERGLYAFYRQGYSIYRDILEEHNIYIY